MVGGISAVNPYVAQYAGYVRSRAALQGAGSIGAASRSAYGQPVQGVSRTGAVSAVSGIRAGSGVDGGSTVPAAGSSQAASSASRISAGSGVAGSQYAGVVSGVPGSRRVGVVSGAAAGQRIGVGAIGRGASPGTPVEPVSPVGAVDADESNGIAYTIPFLRKGMDPAELAVRMRIRYVGPQEEDGPGADGTQKAEKEGGSGIDAAQKAAKEAECQTCKERKYQDGSDDAGVSFKTPTHISPDQAASAVKGHEMEHVVRERAAAEREDRRVVSQSVTMHTAICPECGRVYVSGGTTRTTTASKPETAEAAQQAGEDSSAAA